MEGLDTAKAQDYDIFIKGIGGILATLFGDITTEEADDLTRIGVQLIIGVTTVISFIKRHKKKKEA